MPTTTDKDSTIWDNVLPSGASMYSFSYGDKILRFTVKKGGPGVVKIDMTANDGAGLVTVDGEPVPFTVGPRATVAEMTEFELPEGKPLSPEQMDDVQALMKKVGRPLIPTVAPAPHVLDSIARDLAKCKPFTLEDFNRSLSIMDLGMNSPTGPRNVPSTPTPTPVLWCDLDGTIRHGKDQLGFFAISADQVVIFDGVREILAKYRAAGWRIVGVTNQGGIAMGHLTVADCHAMCARTDELCGGAFDFIVFAEDHPDSPNPMWRSTWNRKPAIGMLVQGEGRLRERYEASEYYPAELGLFIGDRPEDEQCAANAGLRFQWAREWRDGGWEKWLEKS